jgi:hypothetical protein
VFLREGNLWIASIGERTIERQLTFEPPEKLKFFGLTAQKLPM